MTPFRVLCTAFALTALTPLGGGCAGGPDEPETEALSSALVATGLAAGGFTPNVWVRHDLPRGAVSYFPGDLTGDGRTDLVITTASGSYEYTGRAAGGFTPNVWVRHDLPLGAASYF
jgi:hypothetical protein